MTHEHQPPRNEAEEREWALQEQALRAERLGLDPSRDANLQRYRTVMHVLRQPLDQNLPPDFAAQMAAQVRRTSVADTRLELWLSASLLGVLAAMLIGVVMTYGYAWLQLGRALMSAQGWLNPWVLALVVCLVLPGIWGIVIPPFGSSRHR
jgi:anti-sigma factor RsiW